MIIAFAVPGEPKGKARPRTVQIAGHASTYTPKETVMYENLVRLYYQQAARIAAFRPHTGRNRQLFIRPEIHLKKEKSLDA